MVFSADPETGLRFARDVRDQAFVVQNPAKHGARWALHLGRGRTISLSALRRHLTPLNDTDLVASARMVYEEWLARAPAEKAQQEAKLRREQAKRDARNLEERELARRRREQAEREASGRAQFIELLAEFEVHGWDDAPLLPLLTILIRMKEGDPLSEEEVAWLRNQRLYSLAARAEEAEHRRTGDLWHLVQACANYRRAGLPRRALIASETSATAAAPAEARAALFTTRGGAYRDLRDYKSALESAEAALRVPTSNSSYTYALLGGVYFDLGDIERADQYFEKAGTPASSDRWWRSEMDAAGEEQRSAAATYLLTKDPSRFSWARAYVHGTV